MFFYFLNSKNIGYLLHSDFYLSKYVRKLGHIGHKAIAESRNSAHLMTKSSIVIINLKWK